MSSAAEAERKSAIAAQSLFSASAAVNAIPVAGQFASAGLAIAGLFTKLFGGRRKRKKEQAQREKQQREELAKRAAQTQVQATASSGVGLGSEAPVGSTAPVSSPFSPSFSSYGGGAAPSVQQEVLNNTVYKS
jgi:hypothetical protein